MEYNGLFNPNSRKKYKDKRLITSKSKLMLMGLMYLEYLPVDDDMLINEYSL